MGALGIGQPRQVNLPLALVDSHGHLQDPAFDADRAAAYQRAADAGVGVIIPGYDLPSSVRAVALAREWEGTWALVGIHPHEAAALPLGWLERLEDLAHDPHVVGIGEIGLDYYRDLAPREAQADLFRAQLDLARRLGLPVSVHSRSAEEDTVALLQESAVGGVLHCFTGSREMAESLLDLGFFLSFTGVLTFPKADPLRAIAAWAPLDRLLVETDAPYMAPVPHRGHRNEPLWVLETARTLASLRSLSAKEGFPVLMENLHRAFSRL